MKRRGPVIILAILFLIPVLFCVPARGERTEDSGERRVFGEEDRRILQKDVFAAIDRATAPDSRKRGEGKGGGEELTEEYYAGKIPEVIEAIEGSETYVEGSLQQNGDVLVWETTVGLPCCYHPYMEARLHGAAGSASAVPEEDGEKRAGAAMAQAASYGDVITESILRAAGEEMNLPSSVEIGLIQPYWESSSNCLDSAFQNASPSYLEKWEALRALTGGSADYRVTLHGADIDSVAQVMENCGLVMVDSHGITDYRSGLDQTSRANCSYICLTTNTGITEEDTAVQTGPYGDYYHVMTGSGYTAVSGTCIANHMTKAAPHSFVYLTICLGMATDGLCAPLREAGADAVWGYSQEVTFSGDLLYMGDILGKLTEGETLGTAVAYTKEQRGCWDPGYSTQTLEDAIRRRRAFPIVASSQDAYPGQGNVDGLQTVGSTWRLLVPEELGGAELSAASYVYDGTEKEPEVTVTAADGTVLTAGTDYNVVYENNIHAGEARAVVTGTGLYKGVIEKTFTITRRPAAVAVPDAQKTCGTQDPEWPAASVQGGAGTDFDGITFPVKRLAVHLVDGEEDEAYAAGNTGTYADVLVPVQSVQELEQAWPDYRFEIQRGALTILPGPASALGLSAADCVREDLVPGSGRYSIGWSLDVTEGTTVSFSTDGGEWTGEQPYWSAATGGPVTVRVRAQNPNYEEACAQAVVELYYGLGNAAVSCSPQTAVYTGSSQKPEVTVRFGNTVLTEGKDYTVSLPAGRTVAGTYTVLLTGRGDCRGTASASFKIAPAGLEGAFVTAEDAVYNKKTQKPVPKVVLNGKTLVKDRDYTVTYRDNRLPGTARVTVTGKGNYAGTASGTFRILLAFRDIALTDEDYGAVEWGVRTGVVKGTSDTLFSPDRGCTRGEFCTMLWRMYGCPDVSGLKDRNPFADVVWGKGHYKGILWCSAKGIITGITRADGTRIFNSSGKLSRSNLIIMMYKMTKKAGMDVRTNIRNPFSDVKDTNKNLAAYKWAYAKGILTETRLRSAADCTRRELVRFLYRYDGYYLVIR